MRMCVCVYTCSSESSMADNTLDMSVMSASDLTSIGFDSTADCDNDGTPVYVHALATCTRVHVRTFIDLLDPDSRSARTPITALVCSMIEIRTRNPNSRPRNPIP